MSDDIYRHLLRDVVHELIQMARDSASAKEDDFANGRAMGLYEAVSLIESQAVAFQINKSEIGLQDFKADDLLASRK
jgi:hypothetical protein